MRKKARAAAEQADAPPMTETTPTDPKQVGRHLRDLRRERGLSRAEVARSAGLTKRELAAYERGRTAVPDHDLQGLAGSCGVDVADLVTGSVQPGTAPTDAAGAPAPASAVTSAGPVAGDPAHDFFAAPRAADPFAPPPPLTAPPLSAPPLSAPPLSAPPLSAPPVSIPEVAPTPVAANPEVTAPAPGHPTRIAAEPPRVLAMAGAPGAIVDATVVGAGPVEAEAPLASVSQPLAPIAHQPAPVPLDTVPPYWGIGGEEIFLWGDSTVAAAAVPPPAPAPPTSVPIPDSVPSAWATEAPTTVDAAPDASPTVAAVPTAEPDPAPTGPTPAAAPAATADIAWQIGGTIDGPSGDPAAATRWALSDLRVPGDTTIEAVLDFAAGTGFGVLFRATADGHDRMSGYSFDVDPLGGAYVVRQWVENLPHWQTLAQTPASPTRQYGRHAMTIALVGDGMAASVDGVEVMRIPSLADASIATGCEPARGHRVGLQATPTADVTVESFRATPA